MTTFLTFLSKPDLLIFYTFRIRARFETNAPRKFYRYHLPGGSPRTEDTLSFARKAPSRLRSASLET